MWKTFKFLLLIKFLYIYALSYKAALNHITFTWCQVRNLKLCRAVVPVANVVAQDADGHQGKSTEDVRLLFLRHKVLGSRSKSTVL